MSISSKDFRPTDFPLSVLRIATGLHMETLRRLARQDRIPGAYKLGGRWFVNRAAFNRLRLVDEIRAWRKSGKWPPDMP